MERCNGKLYQSLLGILALILLAASAATAQVQITTVNSPVTIDFTGFNGSGFAPVPGAGQLDSDNWASTGMSDGSMNFGDTRTSGDYAQGQTTGGVTSGGFYGLNDGGNDRLMVQPTSADFTPGTLVLRMQNATGQDITRLDVNYDIYINNNEERGNSFNFSYSTDNVTWTPVAAANYTTPEVSDANGNVLGASRSVSITGITVPNGGMFYVRWESDDVSGAGSRDEIALDNISLTSVGIAPVEIANYSFSNDGTSLVSPNNDLAVGVFGPSVDDQLSNVISLPFTFYFNSKPYDRLVISSNGWVGLGNSANNPVFPNTLTSVPTNDPDAWQFNNAKMIAPLWDDLSVSQTGGVSYQSNSNQVQVRWRRMEWGTSNIFITFELTLIRTNNAIRFTYGTGATNSALQSATVGLINDADAPVGQNYVVFNGNVTAGNETSNAAANPGTRLISYGNLPAGASVITNHYDALFVEGNGLLNFGNVNANGGTATRSFTVRNVGSANISMDNTNVMLAGSGQYTVPAFTATITPGGTRAISIQFTGTCPLTLSPITGSASIDIADVTVCHPTPSGVNLTAQEVHPALSVGSLPNVGNVILGQSGQSQITLTNNGNSTYSGTLSISGTGSNQFSISPNPVSVAAGGSTIVTVTFTPTGSEHSANANAASWIANYGMTLTVPEGNQTCNGGTIATRGFSAASLAPRISIAVPFSTDISGNQSDPLLDIGNRIYEPSLGNLTIPQPYSDDILVVNTGSAPVTINDINNAFSGNLNNRFSANAVLVSGNATLIPGSGAAYRVTYSPQKTTSDFPNPASSSSQGQNFGSMPLDVTGNTFYQFAIDPSTPVPSNPGFWHNYSMGAGSNFSPAENLNNTGRVDATIDMHRGFMRVVNTPANSSNQAPTDPNGAPTLSGGLRVQGSLATEVGNGSNGGGALSVTSFWGVVGDVVPNGATITQAGQPGVTSYYVVNNGNANANFYVRKDMIDNSVERGAFSLSVPIPGDPGIIISDVVINGISYHTFTLEPLYLQPSGNNKAFVRFDITFTPNRSNTANINNISLTRTADIQILTDASLRTTAGSSTEPRNDANPYIVRVNGTTLFNDPIVLVDAGTGSQRLVQNLNFGAHELADATSSDYPFGIYDPGGIGYFAPAEWLGRFGLPTGVAGPKGFGVRDTVVQLTVRNLGNAPMTYTNATDLQAFATIGTGKYEIVRITTPQLINSGNFGSGPSSAVFPFTLQPYTGGGNNQEIVLWACFDVRGRANAPVGNIGNTNGQVRAIQSTLADPNPHTTSISYDVTGSAIRPFPVRDLNGGDDIANITDGPMRQTPVHEAAREVIFDNYCGIGGLPPNRDTVHIALTVGNGIPSPTDIGNVNANAVTPVAFHFGQAIVDSIWNDLRIPTMSNSYFVEYNRLVVVRNSFGTVVRTVDISNVGNRDVTLNPSETATFWVAFRPSALVPPIAGTIDALVRIPHTSRNTNIDFPADNGQSHTNASGENGDVYQLMDFVVRGSSLRPAFRLELGNFATAGILGNYVAPNATVDAFNLPYPYKTGVFQGDSNFAAFTLRNSQETGNSFTGIDVSTGRIGIEEIVIDGEDFPDFEIVGFRLPIGTTEPNPVAFPVSTNSGALASGRNFIQWVADLGGITIGNPYVLDRNNGPEATSLYIHFKPRRTVNGATKELRRAVLRIKTTDLCQPEIVYNLESRALWSHLEHSPQAINFGNIQVNDVVQRPLELTNTGNYPALFGPQPNVGGTPLYSHNFRFFQLGFEWFSNFPPITFNLVGADVNPLFPGNSRTIWVQYSPQNTGVQDAILSITYIPEVPPTIANENLLQVDIRGRGVEPVSLSLDPEDGILDFGNVFLGQNATLPIEITNDGDADVEIITPPATIGDFSHDAPGNATINLPAGESITVNFTFTPSTLGAKTQTFTVRAPDAFGGMEYDIVCLGNGVSATALSRTEIDFGKVRVFTDNMQDIFVNNSGGNGNVTAVFTGITGPHAGEYTLRLNGTILSPGHTFNVPAGTNSGTYQIVFTPNQLPNPVTDPNIRSAQVNFTLNGSAASITVEGDGAVPQIDFSGTGIVAGELDFGPVDQNLGSQQVVTVTNIGRFPLDINFLEVTGPNAAEFSVSNIAGTLLDCGESVDVTVTLVPGLATGTLNSLLTANSNSLDPRSVKLTGSRTIPQITMSAKNIDFGSLKVGKDATRSVTIRNATGKSIGINSVEIIGNGASHYKVISTSAPIPGMLASGEEMTFVMEFNPLTQGDKVAKLSIGTTTGQESVNLYGRAVEAGVVLSANTINFGQVPVGKTREMFVSLTNNEDVAVVVETLDIEGDDAGMFSVNESAGFALAAHETRNISVTFNPDTRGTKIAFLRMNTDLGSPLVAGLSGVGGAAAFYAQETLNFGKVSVGESKDMQVEIRNDGDLALEISEYVVSGSSENEFELITALPLELEAGAKMNITVRYKPEYGGEKVATLRLINNTGIPGEIELTGSTPVVGVKGEPIDVPAFGLAANYPNPFNDETTVTFGISVPGNVTVKVFNQLGTVVATLVDGFRAAGRHEVKMVVGDLPAGTYVVHLESNGNVSTHKVTIVK